MQKEQPRSLYEKEEREREEKCHSTTDGSSMPAARDNNNNKDFLSSSWKYSCYVVRGGVSTRVARVLSLSLFNKQLY